MQALGASCWLICQLKFQILILPSFLNERTTKLSSKSRTDLRSCVPGAKFVKESDFHVKSRRAPPKSTENDEKHLSDTENVRRHKCFGVEKSKVANRLKRVFPKFDADRSHVRGVNGRSKFDVASAGFAKRKPVSYTHLTLPTKRIV